MFGQKTNIDGNVNFDDIVKKYYKADQIANTKDTTMLPIRHVKSLGSLLLVAALAACSGQENGAGMQMPPPEVNVITLQSGDVALNEVLPGRLEASRVAEVRARVSGIVEKRLFTEGGDVKAGDVLFQIDDAPYKARYAAALAQQANADAVIAEAKYQAERYQRLAKDNAISELELIRANAQLDQAKAQLEAAKAEVVSTKIDLDYTRVVAPIDGRIGRAFVTEGALVSQAAATPLATVQQTSSMYVNVQQSSRALLQRYRANAAGELVMQQDNSAVQVDIILPDGSVYPHQGQLLFSDINVDQGTGQVMLRAEIPNPESLLLPGLFVQVRLTQATLPGAFLVPQRAVMRNEKADVVFIVGEDNILKIRPVTVAGSVDGQWVITAGVSNGEKLMVDGFQKARPDAPVSPVVLNADQSAANGQ